MATQPFITDEEREARRSQTKHHMMTEGLKGSAIMAAVAVAAHTGLQRFLPAYQRINFRLKIFWWSSAVVGAYWVRAEQGHLERMAELSAEDEMRVAQADAAFRAARTNGQPKPQLK